MQTNTGVLSQAQYSCTSDGIQRRQSIIKHKVLYKKSQTCLQSQNSSLNSFEYQQHKILSAFQKLTKNDGSTMNDNDRECM